MTLSDIIRSVGDDIVQFQNLDVAANSLKWNEKSGTTITFCTEQTLTHNGTRDLGLVVWLPREAVERVMKADKAQNAQKGGKAS